MTSCAIDTTAKADTKDRLSLQLEIVQGQSQDQNAILCLTFVLEIFPEPQGKLTNLTVWR